MTEFKTVGNNRWRMTMHEHGNVTALLVDDWLCCVAPGLCEANSIASLIRNATLPQPLKYVPDRAGRVSLRAELPVTDDTVNTALRLLAASYTQYADAAQCEPSEAMDAAQIAALCDEGGWPATVRGAECRVPLQFDDHRPAVLRSDEGLCASVHVVTPNPECIEATALFLFRAGGSMRLARPVLVDGAARFEAFVPGRVCAENVVVALSALSVALDRFAREAEVLGADQMLAEEFLTLADGEPAESAS